MTIQTKIHLDVSFQDGGGTAPQPYWIPTWSTCERSERCVHMYIC